MTGAVALQRVARGDRDRERIKARARIFVEREIAKMENQGLKRAAKSMSWALAELEKDNPEPYRTIRRLKRWPVTIEQFCQDTDFVGVIDDFQVWPTWRKELRRINPDIVCGEKPVYEVTMGGASGTGKTQIAQLTVAYHIYLLSCFENASDPFPAFNSLTPIVFVLMSHNHTITRDSIYGPLRTMLLTMPYVRKYMTWDKYRDSALYFTSHAIQIKPMLAMVTSMKSQAVCGGIVDELTSMQIIEQSKQVPGPRGLGGRFDQAHDVHEDALNRRTRSFKSRGINPGTLCFLGQTRYQGDFLDRRLSVLEGGARANTYSKRLKRHEMNPEDIAEMQAGRTIRVLVGAPGYSSRLLAAKDRAGRDYDKYAEVETIPDIYTNQVKDDPDFALREICGIATGVISPFIAKREKIASAMERGKRLTSWVDDMNVCLDDRDLPQWLPEAIPQNTKEDPHFVHVDLSRTKDRVGVAVVRVMGGVYMPQLDDHDHDELAPYMEVVVAVSITPSGTNPIEPDMIRSWLMQLGSVHGVNIGGVSYDGFDSAESIRIWLRAGVRSEVIGTDRTSEVYTELRTALYQDRIDLSGNPILHEELLELEFNAEKDKVDHPPKGSKDISDAVAGACYAAQNSRSVRGWVGVVDRQGVRVKVRRKLGRKSGLNRPQGTKRNRTMRSRR